METDVNEEDVKKHSVEVCLNDIINIYFFSVSDIASIGRLRVILDCRI